MRGLTRGGLAPALAVAAALALAVAALYAPVRHFAFVGLDDDLVFTANPVVQGGLSAASLRWSLTALAAYNWHPLTWWSHLLDATLFGANAGGHHLTSVALHAANAALLFALLRAATGALWPSAAAAALFALHPLRVESVAWVAERKDVLGGLFWLLTCLAWVRWCRRPAAGRYAAAAALLALGLMAKPTLVTLPFALLLLDVWPLGRAIGPGRTPWPRLLLEKAPLFALAAAAAAVTMVAQRGGGSLMSLAANPLPQRLANAAAGFGWYLAKFVWPAGLMVPRLLPPGGWPARDAAIGAAALAAGTAVALALWRRRPYAPVGWLWHLGLLVPVAGIVQAGAQAVADRYSYLPQIGLAVAVVWGARDLARRLALPTAVPALACAAAAVALAAATAAQLPHWRDTESLFTRTLAVDPGNFVAANNLGLLWASQGRHEEAIALFRRSLSRGRQESRPRYNVAVSLMALGRHEEALRELSDALAAGPAPALASQVHLAVATALLRLGRTAESGPALERAVFFDPANDVAAYNLGTLRLIENRNREAAVLLAGVVARSPGNRDAREALREAERRLAFEGPGGAGR